MTRGEAIRTQLEGLSHFSAGVAENCDECPATCDFTYFSWSPCDLCGSNLGGMRYPAHAIDKETKELYHFDICTDCLLYDANLETKEVIDMRGS